MCASMHVGFPSHSRPPVPKEPLGWFCFLVSASPLLCTCLTHGQVNEWVNEWIGQCLRITPTALFPLVGAEWRPPLTATCSVITTFNHKQERIPEVFIVESLKPTARVSRSLSIEKAFLLTAMHRPCLQQDQGLSLCQGQELSCGSHGPASAASIFSAWQRLSFGLSTEGNIRDSRRKRKPSFTFKFFPDAGKGEREALSPFVNMWQKLQRQQSGLRKVTQVYPGLII